MVVLRSADAARSAENGRFKQFQTSPSAASEKN